MPTYSSFSYSHYFSNLFAENTWTRFSVGVVIICGALCADAAIGNVQEKTMKQYSLSTTDIVSYLRNADLSHTVQVTKFSNLLVNGNNPTSVVAFSFAM